MTHQNLQIEGMSCASCVGRVEAALARVPGVETAQVNIATSQAAIDGSAGMRQLIAAVAEAGYAARALTPEAPPTDTQASEAQAYQTRFLIALALTLPVFVLEMGGHVFPAFHHLIARTIGLPTSWIIQFVLTTIVLAWPGRVFFAKGFPALVRRAPEMNALVAIGASAAWAFSTLVVFMPQVLPETARAVYFEAAAVIVTLILMGRWLEARAKGHANQAIRKLLDLQPQTALRVEDGVAREVPLDSVAVGDILQVKSGARIPVDGVIHSGQTHVDEAMITGEPMPVHKTAGDQVTAGTINGSHVIEMTAQAVGADTALARIVAMVSHAQGARLPIQDRVNQIAMWFVPVVILVALATVAVWLFIGTIPQALVAGVSVLIIACPCAMGLAVPVAILVGSGRASELGLLYRDGAALQRLAEVDVVAFDKTGTLTTGEMSVSEVVTAGGAESSDILRLASAVEAGSTHPVGQAIVDEAGQDGLPAVQDIQEIAGYGLQAIASGDVVLVGAARLMAQHSIDTTTLSERADPLAKAGSALVYVARGGKALGVIAISDNVRPDARVALGDLHQAGVKTALITGDSAGAAAHVAAAIGITQVQADVLPGGKAAALAELGEKVAFVGDGINDAPALAAAHVGLALGTGTDVAKETADIVIVAPHVRSVPTALRLSRAVMRNIRQNLFWAFAYNTVLIPVAAAGLLSPMLAAGAMALSSLFVVSNALRLRRVS